MNIYLFDFKNDNQYETLIIEGYTGLIEKTNIDYSITQKTVGDRCKWQIFQLLKTITRKWCPHGVKVLREHEHVNLRKGIFQSD